MKVFVAGASGALGVQLVPMLVAAGRSLHLDPSKQDGLQALGARPVVADALDPDAVARVVGEAEPEVIVHPLDPDPPGALQQGLAAILQLEQAVTTIEWGEGVVLRYGNFYGLGTQISLAPNADARADPQARFPLVGDGGGVWSHIRIEDAAAATTAAVDHGQPGVYNIVDDDPAPVRAWLPALASALGAKPPRRIPRWLGRLAAGQAATVMMTDVRGASNAKAKRELGWQLRYPSWRLGFTKGLG
jgi:nucleoside-diphosphate-sugar epimerase